MQKTNMKNGKSLSKLIQDVVNESIKSSLYRNSVEEKKKQQSLSEEDDDLFDDKGRSDKEEKKDDSGEKESTPSKTTDAEKEKLKKGDITSKDIVDRLNAIRSGKSFKDDTVAAHFDEYVESLSKPERVALLAFLKGISQIVTGEIEPDQATGPGSNPANVKMEKGDEEKKKTIKPNVIKAPEKAKTEKKSEEDTSGPVPITPKKK